MERAGRSQNSLCVLEGVALSLATPRGSPKRFEECMKLAPQSCLLPVLLAAVLGAAAPVLAQPVVATPSARPAAAAGKVGFVDLEIVLDSSKSVRTIVTEVDADLAEQSRQIDLKTVELQKLRRTLEEKGAVLSEAQRQDRQDKAVEMLREVDEMEYKFKRTVRDKQRTTIEPLLEQVIRFTGDVAKREGYDLVVRGEVVLYGRDSVDLTPLVIKELDSRVEELRKAVEKPRPAAAPAPAGPVAPTPTAAAPSPTSAPAAAPKP